MATNRDEVDFEVKVHASADESVVTIRGEVDLATADLVWEALEQAATFAPRVILDLAETTFIDSSGLNVIVRAYRRFGASAEAVVIRSARESTVTLLRLTAIDTLVTIEP